MELSEELLSAMSPHQMFNINLFGLKIPVTDTVVIMWIVMAVIIIFAIVFTRKMKQIPTGKQNIVELYVEFINNFAHTNIGHHGKDFAPYLGTILLFLIFSNIISIFNFIPSAWLAHLTGVESMAHFGIRPPTRDINVTVCMAVMTIVVVIYSGFRYKGFKGWLKYMVDPVPVILPFKLLDYVIRPLSLSLRLFGNIMGAFIVMELLYLALPAFIPAAASLYFDLFDGILQAYVFVFLSSLYIAEAIE